MTLSETVQNDATQSGSSVSRFRAIFPKAAKPLIAMAHVPALPGTPSYDPLQGVGGLVRHVRDEVELLVEAGFDAVMFCNEHDRPYTLKADLVASAVMARVATECRPDTIPFGVDYLWDPQCALAAAVACEASFIREVATGSWESDMGNWSPDAAELLRRRRSLDAGSLAILHEHHPGIRFQHRSADASSDRLVRGGLQPPRCHPRLRADGRCRTQRHDARRGP